MVTQVRTAVDMVVPFFENKNSEEEQTSVSDRGRRCLEFKVEYS